MDDTSAEAPSQSTSDFYSQYAHPLGRTEGVSQKDVASNVESGVPAYTPVNMCAECHARPAVASVCGHTVFCFDCLRPCPVRYSLSALV